MKIIKFYKQFIEKATKEAFEINPKVLYWKQKRSNVCNTYKLLKKVYVDAKLSI